MAAQSKAPDAKGATRLPARDVVAKTYAEAKRLAIEGGLFHAWREYLTPTYHRFGVLKGLLQDESVKPESLDAAYLAEQELLTGSPETVTRKIQQWCKDLGVPFGILLIFSYDYLDNVKPWQESMRLIAKEVLPHIPS